MIRFDPILLVVALSTFPAAPVAQQAGERPTLVTIRVGGVPELLGLWPETAIGRLAAAEEVAEAAARAIAYTRRELERRDAILAAAIATEGVMEPGQLARMFSEPDLWDFFAHPFEELRSIELRARLPGEGGGLPLMTMSACCLPRYEGRWTQAFEAEARRLASSPMIEAADGAKVGGNPAHAFAVRGAAEDRTFPQAPLGLWMLHVPGTFVRGTGPVTDYADFEPARPLDSPEVGLMMDFEQYMELFTRVGFGAPDEFALLGFDKLRRLDWTLRFAGELLLDEISVVVDGEPSGAIGALLNGDAELPSQALPAGAIAQVRAAVSVAGLLEFFADMPGSELSMTDENEKDLLAALTGGVAASVAAPAPGGLLPRIFLSLGVADAEALGRILDAAVATLTTRKVTYDGVACTLIKFDDLPQGMQPAFCVVDGTLHVAESGRSLRALLKAQKGGVFAMDVGDAPLPEGAGEVLPTLDVRVDEVALYRAFRDIWLPLYELRGGPYGGAALARKDMPSVDVVEEYCGKSRGVLRRDGDRYTYQHLGALGGPEFAALTMTWGPMISGEMRDYGVEALSDTIARQKLEAVWPALETFQKERGRWPADLGELFASADLANDALLLPGDDLAEAVALPGGGEVRSSFRYFAEPVTMGADAAGSDVLLLEIRADPWNRAALDTTGEVPRLHGGEKRKPIDQFR